MGWLFLLLTAYLVILFKLIIMKDLPPDGGYRDLQLENSGMKGLPKANFIPFKTIRYYGTLQEDLPTGIQNLGGNIILFIPVGFLLSALPERKTLWKVLLFTLLISAIFEFVQLISGYGTCDVDDLFLNSIGGLIGYGVYILLVKLISLFRE
jgi:glycopeptide antibiotics resistance protein